MFILNFFVIYYVYTRLEKIAIEDGREFNSVYYSESALYFIQLCNFGLLLSRHIVPDYVIISFCIYNMFIWSSFL